MAGKKTARDATGNLRSRAAVTPAAEAYLKDHPLLADVAARTADLLCELEAAGAPFTQVELDLIVDAEIPDYKLVAFTVGVHADWEETRRWDHEITQRQIAMEAGLSAKARDASQRALMVWLVPEFVPEL